MFLLFQGRTKTVGHITPTGGRTVDDAIRIVWKIIDEAKAYIEDPRLTSEEKRCWAKTLADTIGVLNKL
jgi:hypothetical protein